MYVAALGLGFTVKDLKRMPLNRLLWFITQHNLLNQRGNAQKEEEKVIVGNDEMMKRFL